MRDETEDQAKEEPASTRSGPESSLVPVPGDPMSSAFEVDARPRPAPDVPATSSAIRRHRIAFGIALVADILQWIAFPLFMGGGLSPADDVLDVAVAFALIRLIGWHWALLPALVAELVPFVDLVPSWTAAVWLATRGKR